MAFFVAEEWDDYNYNIIGEKHYRDDINAALAAGKPCVRSYSGWIKVGAAFWLVPEPDNQHDPNAVAVHAGTQQYNPATVVKVGHIKRYDAVYMAKHLNKPFPIDGVFIGKAKRFGVKLDYKTLDKAALLPWRLSLDSDQEWARTQLGTSQTAQYTAVLSHQPDHPNGPDTVAVVIGPQTVGHFGSEQKLWGPNIDGTTVDVTVTREDYYYECVATGTLPDNATEPTGWKCGPYCAVVDEISPGRYQAVGRLRHLRYKITTCDDARAAFREAKRLTKGNT